MRIRSQYSKFPATMEASYCIQTTRYASYFDLEHNPWSFGPISHEFSSIYDFPVRTFNTYRIVDAHFGPAEQWNRVPHHANATGIRGWYIRTRQDIFWDSRSPELGCFDYNHSVRMIRTGRNRKSLKIHGIKTETILEYQETICSSYLVTLKWE